METQTDVHATISPRRGVLRLVALISVLAIAAIALFATVANGRPDDPLIASTDQIKLRQSDIQALIADLDANTRSRLLQDTTALSALIRRELGRRLLQQRALDDKWYERDDVKARLERMRLDFIASSFLEAQAAPPASFPTDAEVETAYQLNQQRFVTPRQFHLAQIYVRRPQDRTQVATAHGSAVALAEELRKNPGRFAETARVKSDDAASAPKGGELGWLPEDQIQPGIRAAAIGLASGDVSEAIELADGWHILRMIETRPSAIAPLAQVREALVATLRQQRAQENATAYMTRLMTEKQAAIDEITLAKAQKSMH